MNLSHHFSPLVNARLCEGRPDLQAINFLIAGRARYIGWVALRHGCNARELYKVASEFIRLEASNEAGRYVGADKVAGGVRYPERYLKYHDACR